MSNFIVECKCESVASLIYSVFSHLSSVICLFCLYLIQDIRKEELVLCRGTKKKKELISKHVDSIYPMFVFAFFIYTIIKCPFLVTKWKRKMLAGF